ncbi:MAG: hypothetical protein QNJ22_02935 [Desulfosarcinaceae bacterium]|nr:hypothetical protein [Desulfosarcinaceae bacterium]
MEASGGKKLFFGMYLCSIIAIIAYCLVSIWDVPSGASENVWETSYPFIRPELIIHHEVRLILLVLLAGAMGSCIHVATSFATYVGNKSLVDSWYWWYLLRPFIGMALALVFYFAIRGGLLLVTGANDDSSLNPFGIAALSGLVGMFSKQATDKLSDVFSTLFKTDQGDEERANNLASMRPVRELMLGINKISAYEMKADEEDNQVGIKELHAMLRGGVTRIIILYPDRAVKYVIHQSMLFKFISNKLIENTGSPVDVATLKLDDFLQFEDMRQLVEGSLAFVSESAALGDAKKVMEQTDYCQDVFVTKNGGKKEPVLGWLTNNDIARYSKA